jgi:hypothetical protein
VPRLDDAKPELDLVVLDNTEAVPDLHFLRHGADCAERLGKADIQEMLFERGLAIDGGDPGARAMLLFARDSLLIRTGHIDPAEQFLKEAAAAFGPVGDVRSRGPWIETRRAGF